MSDQEVTGEIIGAAIRIHRRLGPGLLESAYEACLEFELEKAGLQVQRQKAVPLVYESVKLECGFRADLVVERKVVVEIKCKKPFILLIRPNCCPTFACWTCGSAS